MDPKIAEKIARRKAELEAMGAKRVSAPREPDAFDQFSDPEYAETVRRLPDYTAEELAQGADKPQIKLYTPPQVDPVEARRKELEAMGATRIPTPTAGETAVRGFGKGITSNLYDEGVARLLTMFPSQDVTIGEIYDWYFNDGPYPKGLRDNAGKSYEENLANIRATIKAGEDAHPVAAKGGELAGMITQAASPVGRAMGPAKNATRAERLVRASQVGAGMGGLNAYGASEAEDLTGQLQDTATGAATGAVLAPLASYGVEKVGQGLTKLGTATREGAQNALGKLRTLSRTQAARAAGVVGEGAEAVGDDLLENEAVRAGDNAAKILARTTQKSGQLGRELAAQLDEYGEKFDMVSFAKRAEDQILAEMRINGIIDPARRSEAAAVISMLRQYGKMAEKGPISFSTAQALRESLEKQGSEAARSLSRIMGEEISDQFSAAGVKAAQAAGLTGDALEDATLDATVGSPIWEKSRAMGSLARAGESAKDLAAEQSKVVKDAAISGGLSTVGAVGGTLLGGPGVGVGGAALGAGIGVGKRLLQDRGASTAAVMSKKAADKIFQYAPSIDAFERGMSRVGQGVSSSAPVVAQPAQKTTYNVLKEMYDSDPESLGPVGPILFSGKSPEESAATLHVLQQMDGGKLIKQLQENKQPRQETDIEL